VDRDGGRAKALIAPEVESNEPTVDDIKKILQPLVELHPELRKFLGKNKLTQKYWIGDFTDYILHKVYHPTLTSPPRKEKGK